MADTDFDLRKLLASVEPEIFLRDYWEKQPLHLSRKEPDRYSALFRGSDVDAVIAFTRPTESRIRNAIAWRAGGVSPLLTQPTGG